MAEVINALWIGDSLGLLERLAITSFLHHGHAFHLHCYDEVANIPPGTVVKDANEILPASSIFRYEQGTGKGSVAAFSNLFRYKLLQTQGGWWVDCDVVCLKPFDFPEPVVLASEHTQAAVQLSNAIIKLPSGHPVAQECYERASQRDSRTLRWGEIGPLLFTEAALKGGLAPSVKGVHVFCPIPCWGWALFWGADARQCRSFLTEGTYAVHLWHEMWRRAGVARTTKFPATSYLAQLLKFYSVEI